MREEQYLEDIRAKLLKLYPNQKIDSICKDGLLYQKCWRTAKQMGMNLKDFLAHLGFESTIQSKDKQNINERLEGLFPDKIVINLRKVDSNLYDRLRDVSKRNNKTIENYLLDNGFQYQKSTSKKQYVDVEYELGKMYPDGIVKNIYRDSPYLHQKLYRSAKQKGLTMKQLLEKYGFQYNGLNREFVDVGELLHHYFPDKVVCNLLQVNNTLYKRIEKAARKEGKTLKLYLSELGFSYQRKQREGGY